MLLLTDLLYFFLSVGNNSETKRATGEWRSAISKTSPNVGSPNKVIPNGASPSPNGVLLKVQFFLLHILKFFWGESVKFLGFHPEIFQLLPENIGRPFRCLDTDRCESKQIGRKEPID